jgi:hypothetical protein
MKKRTLKLFSQFMFSVVVITILSLPEIHAALRPYNYLGTVTAIDTEKNTIEIQTEYENGWPEWIYYTDTLQGEAPQNAVNGLKVNDYVEVASLGVPGEKWIAIGKMESGQITDIYGDPAFLMSDILGDYKVTYENTPDCMTCSDSTCSVEYTTVVITEENGHQTTMQVYPGNTSVYKGDPYTIEVTFHSGEAYSYPECSDNPPPPGPQVISDFTIHISKTSDVLLWVYVQAFIVVVALVVTFWLIRKKGYK